MALQSLMEKRENQERLAANMGHHDTIPQPRDGHRPSFHHPQGPMGPSR